MPQVDITINGRPYTVACGPGQEARLLQLAHYLDQRVREAARSGASNPQHVLMLAGLMLADELFDARNHTDAPTGDSEEQTQILVTAVETLTERINALAGRLETG